MPIHLYLCTTRTQVEEGRALGKVVFLPVLLLLHISHIIQRMCTLREILLKEVPIDVLVIVHKGGDDRESPASLDYGGFKAHFTETYLLIGWHKILVKNDPIPFC